MTEERNSSSKVAEPETAYVSDDGLTTPTVGPWAEKKYKLVHMYDELFTTGMKKLWGTRVYVDLYAGAGKAKIRDTSKILLGSPLLSLNIPDKFDKYIFCEKNEALIEGLETRVRREYSDVPVSFVGGDCNEKVDEILGLIPRGSKDNKVLTFCFVDPFSLDIEFETIRKLSSRFTDFLILFAFSDAKRNESVYIKENNDRIDKFLGTDAWREKWINERKKGAKFVRFLAEEYVHQMILLDYRKESLKTMIENRSGEHDLSLYHLAFFSRHERGYQFWREVRKYALKQPELPFEM